MEVEMSVIVEFTRTHPLVYGKFKGYGTVSTAGNRMQADFDTNDGQYTAHFGETDSGQAFWWLTKKDEDGRMEFKQFKRYKQALQYGKDRFRINLSGLKSHLRDNPAQPKWYWK